MSERRVPRPELEWSLYEPIATEQRGRAHTAVDIRVDSGRAVHVAEGQVVRLSCPERAQVADVCVFAEHDPTERLWANQTLNREGAHVSIGSRLWGTMPLFRPLATVVADTVLSRPTAPGARHHIVLGAHCNRWLWYLATGRSDHPNCYDQLCAAAEEAGIPTHLIHDNINFFQKTRVDAQSDQYVTEASDAVAGDYVELYAEIDIVLAISACPMGSGAHTAESGRRDPSPLRAEVFSVSHRPPPFSYSKCRELAVTTSEPRVPRILTDPSAN